SNIIISDYETRKKLYKYRMNNGVFGCNMAGYKACEVAYNKCEEWLSQFINVIDRNRIFVENFIKENIPEIKVSRLEGTYLMWLDCRQLGMDYIKLEKFMIEKALLFNDEGYIFGEGGKGFERINIACPLSVLSQAMERLKKALDSIKN
ncbi:MAG TPA: pyridoxal phosphate-dependent aminotransferase, partial [Candidatus Fimicola cottocaccae]|nr:pyridoxal phosphate-dependent aminotransferase [Candidatus Fimicola cottocaccae]